MKKLQLVTLLGQPGTTILLNKEARQALEDLVNPIEIESVKMSLFNMAVGVAELALSVQKLSQDSGDIKESYIASDIKWGLYTVDRFYKLLTLIKYEE